MITKVTVTYEDGSVVDYATLAEVPEFAVSAENESRDIDETEVPTSPVPSEAEVESQTPEAEVSEGEAPVLTPFPSDPIAEVVPEAPEETPAPEEVAPTEEVVTPE